MIAQTGRNMGWLYNCGNVESGTVELQSSKVTDSNQKYIKVMH